MATVRHLRASRNALLSELLDEALGMRTEEVMRLFHFGAVYHSKSSAIQFKEHNMTPVRLLKDLQVEIGDYIRVHPNPRIFPTYDEVDWKKRIIDIFPRFILVNKPAGVPSHATSDNRWQNCMEGVRSALGVQ